MISAGVTVVLHRPEAHLFAEMITSTDNDPSPAIIHDASTMLTGDGIEENPDWTVSNDTTEDY